jgi:hypothetical protein
MTNPSNELGRAETAGSPEPAADDSSGDPQVNRFPGSVERAEEHLFHFREIATDEEKLIDLEQQETDGMVAALKERTPPELPGVDLSTVKQVDPEFDDEAFRAIARETFYKVRETRTLQNPPESAELLSPQMQREMQHEISGDAASHRHHLLPFLQVNDVVIAGAKVAGGQEEIRVRFSVSAGEEDADDRTGQALAGGSTEHSWEELWQFTRNPQVDTSASDERHEITSVRTDQWLVAHRGWVVTEITRLPVT